MTRSDRTWLTAIAAVAAVPRLWLAAHQAVAYDGYWHLFIARQDHWPTFLAEIFRNAHPPLYFLLLKLIIPFSRSLLAYRSISVLAGTLSVIAFGTVALRVIDYKAVAFAATAAFGLAISSIWLSIEIRSYAVAMLFFLLALAALARLVDSPEDASRDRRRVLFAVLASGAILCHYGMVFPIAAAAAVTMLLSWRSARQHLRATLLRDGVAVAVPLAVFALAWALHARHWVEPLSHLPDFYYSTSGVTASEFLIAGFGALATMFSPIDPGALGASLSVAVLLFSGSFAIIEARAARTNATMIHGVFVVLTVSLAMAGLLDVYPFGGEMRQQYLLFPFLVLSIFSMLDRLIRAIPAGSGRIALASVLALCVAVSGAGQFRAFPLRQRNLFAPAMDQLIARVPAAQPGSASRSALWVDQFSLIVIFSRHHSAKWRYLGSPGGDSAITAYRIEDGTGELLIVRDSSRWTVNLEEPKLYRDIAVHARALGVPRVVLVSADQTRRRLIGRRMLSSIEERSRAAGLAIEGVERGGAAMLAVFRVAEGAQLR